MYALFLLAVAAAAAPASAPTILIEAEGFADCGGWVVDQQMADQMGSPYLLAHGMGEAVKEAVTEVAIPVAGDYRVWVRTRDWVAPWHGKGAPGRFHLVVDGKPLAATFGAKGAAWHWQDGGRVTLPKGNCRLALRDLAGFDGRCDAIVLSADQGLVPPNSEPELRQFRRRLLGLPDKPAEAGEFDLVVVGGGIAGTCAAISAARLGCNVALVHNRPVLGGNNSSEVRVGLSGKIRQEPYPALGNLVAEIAPIGFYDFQEARRFPDRPESKRILAMDPGKAEHNAAPAENYEDDKKLAVARAEKNLTLFLNAHAYAVEKDGDRIAAVLVRDIRSSAERRIVGRLFADCSGDASLGFLAGADYRVGRESRAETGEARAPDEADKLVMGTSIQWYAKEGAAPAPFPECPWAVQFNEETFQRQRVPKGDWDWETGMNRDQVNDFEAVRDHGLRAVFGHWAYLKNHSSQKDAFAKHKLAWVAYIGGKRESRRLLGDVILKQQDIEGRIEFPDASVTTTWSIDLHFPAPKNSKHFPGEEFRTVAIHGKIEPYAIPYRCLYSRNIANLFMAGRNISVTHVALGTVRVQKTTGMMGEVVGMAAAICKDHSAGPRDVYEKYLDELKSLMRKGVGRK